MAKAFPNTGVTTGLAADRTALTSPYNGQYFYETDTKREWVYDGVRWVLTNQASTTSGVTGVNNLIVPPMVSAIKTTAGAQAIANVTSTAVTFAQTDEFDTDDMHSTSSNNTRLTITTAGVYQVSASCRWQANTSGRRLLDVYRNGSGFAPVIRSEVPPAASGFICNALSYPISCAANDYLELIVYQSSGVTLNVEEVRFAAVWVGRTS